MSQVTPPVANEPEEFEIPPFALIPFRLKPRYCAKCGCEMFATDGEHVCEFRPAIALPLAPDAPFVFAA